MGGWVNRDTGPHWHDTDNRPIERWSYRLKYTIEVDSLTCKCAVILEPNVPFIATQQTDLLACPNQPYESTTTRHGLQNLSQTSSDTRYPDFDCPAELSIRRTNLRYRQARNSSRCGSPLHSPHSDRTALLEVDNLSLRLRGAGTRGQKFGAEWACMRTRCQR